MDFDLYRVSQAEKPKYKDALRYTYNMFYSPADDGYVATVLEMQGLSSIAETPLAALMGQSIWLLACLRAKKALQLNL